MPAVAPVRGGKGSQSLPYGASRLNLIVAQDHRPDSLRVTGPLTGRMERRPLIESL